MTGTTVKDVSSAFSSMAAGAAKGVKGAASADSFQTVWNNRMGRGAESGSADVQSAEKPQKSGLGQDNVKPGDSLKAKDESRVSTDEQMSVSDGAMQPEETEALSLEQLEKAMEVLGAAAVELMQQIADTFGIPAEKLQGVMEELDMEPLDVLQPEELAGLLLKLGGAQDACALVTDEALYGSYKMLMEQMNEAVNETAKKLDTEPQQVVSLLGEVSLQEEERAVPVEVVSEKPEAVRHYENYENGQPAVEKNVTEESRPRTEDALQKDEGQRPGEEQDKGQTANSFAQDLRMAQPRQELQQTQSTAQSSPWTSDTQDIMRQIMDYMKIQLNADTTNLEMKLHPASLGTLQVQVQSKAGLITANFVAQNETVKAALESQIVQLKESFAEQGVKVEAIEVTVQSHAFERNLDQGRGQSQGDREPARRSRVRRINLNDSLAMESVGEEDALTADMMAAGGNTVDYTA